MSTAEDADHEDTCLTPTQARVLLIEAAERLTVFTPDDDALVTLLYQRFVLMPGCSSLEFTCALAKLPSAEHLATRRSVIEHCRRYITRRQAHTDSDTLADEELYHIVSSLAITPETRGPLRPALNRHSWERLTEQLVNAASITAEYQQMTVIEREYFHALCPEHSADPSGLLETVYTLAACEQTSSPISATHQAHSDTSP